MNQVQHQRTELKPFDWDLKITKNDIPDPQNLHFNEHAKITLPKVGISKLAVPIIVKGRDGTDVTVKGEVSAQVSLDSTEARGINMSRLARGFYEHVDGKGAIHLLDLLDVVQYYKDKLPATNAYLKVGFDYSYSQKHMLEEHSGWLFYPTQLEINSTPTGLKTYLTIDYTYNSACPCSLELSQFARQQLDTIAISHSQRSIAKIKVEFDPKAQNLLWIEDLIDLCRKIQPTEVLSGIVTRVGELSMCLAVGASTGIGFIEDLLRKFWSGLNNDPRILDFYVELEHQESLNQNFAVGGVNKSLELGKGLSGI